MRVHLIKVVRNADICNGGGPVGEHIKTMKESYCVPTSGHSKDLSIFQYSTFNPIFWIIFNMTDNLSD